MASSGGELRELVQLVPARVLAQRRGQPAAAAASSRGAPLPDQRAVHDQVGLRGAASDRPSTRACSSPVAESTS